MANLVFTGDNAPPADRFRLGDAWLNPDGRRFRVRDGMAPGIIVLRAIGPFAPSETKRSNDIRGWRRAEWGGVR